MCAKKIKFTLIELLIVIAIIAILASMLMPALKSARNQSRAISCLNRLKQSGVCMSLYATDYNGWAPRTYDGNTKKTWSSTLYDQQYVNSRDIFVCPSAKPENYLSQGYTYGIWSYDYSYQIKLWGNFSHPGNIPYTKDGPSCHIVAADSIAKTGTSSQIYHIYGWVNSERFFDLRHNRKCNAYFADGHAEGVNSERTQAYGIRYYAKEGVLCSNW